MEDGAYAFVRRLSKPVLYCHFLRLRKRRCFLRTQGSYNTCAPRLPTSASLTCRAKFAKVGHICAFRTRCNFICHRNATYIHGPKIWKPNKPDLLDKDFANLDLLVSELLGFCTSGTRCVKTCINFWPLCFPYFLIRPSDIPTRFPDAEGAP